jgi:hypothetical protein
MGRTKISALPGTHLDVQLYICVHLCGTLYRTLQKCHKEYIRITAYGYTNPGLNTYTPLCKFCPGDKIIIIYL